MKKINELISVEKPILSPLEISKQQINKANNVANKKRDSRNIPSPIKRNIDGSYTNGKPCGDSRCRFKLLIYWKPEFDFTKAKRGKSYIPSIDAFYKQKDGLKFWYIDEALAYSKLFQLVKHKYYGQFSTAIIVMCIDDEPFLNNSNYNYKVYKNVYGNEYEFEKVNKSTGEILPLYNFKTSTQNRVANVLNQQCLVQDNFVNILDFKRQYQIN